MENGTTKERFKARWLSEPHKDEIVEVVIYTNRSFLVSGKDWGYAGPDATDGLFKQESFEPLPEEMDLFDCLESPKKADKHHSDNSKNERKVEMLGDNKGNEQLAELSRKFDQVIYQADGLGDISREQYNYLEKAFEMGRHAGLEQAKRLAMGGHTDE